MMAFSTELEALMPDTVTASTVTGYSTDGYGTPSYSTGTDYTARVVRANEMVRTREGTEAVSDVQAWLASTSDFDPYTRFTLPDGSTPTVLSVQAFPDEDGLHHVKVSFGS